MSRKDAHAFAASLAATLMVSIVVFQAGDGTFGAYLNSQPVLSLSGSQEFADLSVLGEHVFVGA
ncbi:hypothetical protein [Cypionkella psychrotolerans]|uniref:hypothetical protein n=1 Tax=Cypionkella psychrotolerans TaxID=1678131 RepID=UPI0006B5AAF1